MKPQHIAGRLLGKLLTSHPLTRLWPRLPFSRKTRNRILWLLSPKFLVGVIGLVLDEQGQILLMCHTYRPDTPWGLPGGGLRPGESLEECLQRELREEANMEVEIDKLLSVQSHFDRQLVDMIFACHPAPGQSLANFQPNAEVSEARFFDIENLPEAMPPTQRRLIGVALEKLRET